MNKGDVLLQRQEAAQKEEEKRKKAAQEEEEKKKNTAAEKAEEEKRKKVAQEEKKKNTAAEKEEEKRKAAQDDAAAEAEKHREDEAERARLRQVCCECNADGAGCHVCNVCKKAVHGAGAGCSVETEEGKNVCKACQNKSPDCIVIDDVGHNLRRRGQKPPDIADPMAQNPFQPGTLCEASYWCVHCTCVCGAVVDVRGGEWGGAMRRPDTKPDYTQERVVSCAGIGSKSEERDNWYECTPSQLSVFWKEQLLESCLHCPTTHTEWISGHTSKVVYAVCSNHSTAILVMSSFQNLCIATFTSELAATEVEEERRNDNGKF